MKVNLNKIRDKIGSWIFVFPAVLIVISLIIFPVFSSLFYSFTSKHLTRPTYNFVGFKNYIEVLTDKRFYHAFWFSIKWTALSITLQLAVGMLLALLVNKVNFGKTVYRTILIIPWAFPAIVISIIWKYLLNGVYGFVPNLLVDIGITDHVPQFLSDGNLVFPTILFINIWFGAPMMMVNILSALQTIPTDQYEAAKIDGAKSFQRFRHITVPHIKNVIGLLVVLRTIWVFTNFDMVFLLTGGGPANATTTLPIFAYNTGWGTKLLGKSAAITIIMLLFLIVLALFIFTFLDKWEGGTSDGKKS